RLIELRDPCATVIDDMRRERNWRVRDTSTHQEKKRRPLTVPRFTVPRIFDLGNRALQKHQPRLRTFHNGRHRRKWLTSCHKNHLARRSFAGAWSPTIVL